MRKLWKILKRTCIGLAMLFAVLLITVAILNWRANSRLEQRLAAIRSAGDPVALADLANEPVPPDQNAITYLQRVERQTMAIVAELRDVTPNDGPFREGTKLNAEGAAKVRATLKAYPEVVPTLAQAVACPAYDPTYDFSVPQPVVLDAVIQQAASRRAVARVMMLQADLLIFGGQREEALQTCVQVLQYGRQLENEPFTVGFLISLAVRGAALNKINQILVAGPISAESHTRLTDELAQNDDMQGFIRCLKSERVHGIASFREMSIAKLPLWYVRNWESDYLDMMATELEMGASPKHDIENELATQQTALAAATMLTRLAHPALQATREALDRVRSTGRCIYALSVFQQTGTENANSDFDLNSLGLDKKFITDPYTGDPLLVKQTPEGWVVYSVGRNGKDDGGVIGSPFDDVGAGPLSAEE